MSCQHRLYGARLEDGLSWPGGQEVAARSSRLVADKALPSGGRQGPPVWWQTRPSRLVADKASESGGSVGWAPAVPQLLGARVAAIAGRQEQLGMWQGSMIVPRARRARHEHCWACSEQVLCGHIG